MQISPLTNETIQTFINSLADYARTQNVSRRRITWMLLTLEEILLKYKDSGDSHSEFGYSFRNRLGSLMVELSVRGEPLYDERPEGENDSDEDVSPELLRNLLNDLYGNIRFRSRNGWNYITVFLPKGEKKPRRAGATVIYAIILGGVIGAVLKSFVPDFAFRLSETVVDPIYSLLLELIRGCTEAFIFVSLIAAISRLSDMKVFRKMGRKMLLFFAFCSLVLFLLCVLVCIPVFHTAGVHSSGLDISGLLSLLLDSVPTSLVTPFAERNMIQIVLLGIVMGVVLLSVSDRMSSLVMLVEDLKLCFTRLMQNLLKVVPFLVILSMVKVMITVGAPQMAKIWKIIAVGQGLDIFCFAFSLAFVSVKYKVPVVSLYAKISPALHVAVSTGSTTASIPELYRIVHPRLGVDEKFANYWIPLSSTLFSPSVIFPLTVYAFFSAECQGVAITLSWLAALFMLVLVMGIASPRVPGGLVATVAIILTQLGMNSDQLALIMSANVVMLYLDAGFAVALRTMAAVVLSDRQKLCDLNVLRSSEREQVV